MISFPATAQNPQWEVSYKRRQNKKDRGTGLFFSNTLELYYNYFHRKIKRKLQSGMILIWIFVIRTFVRFALQFSLSLKMVHLKIHFLFLSIYTSIATLKSKFTWEPSSGLAIGYHLQSIHKSIGIFFIVSAKFEFIILLLNNWIHKNRLWSIQCRFRLKCKISLTYFKSDCSR